ncbi:MAG: response regulator transcription factor [Flavobacteriales bacterium]|jgi:DNA-binding response OmpR family regulator|nr:response regulator transcription factor [Flavobacteriales bacterium]|tara:strand:- start:4673 stop:5359 length:687 start_codon:yes stop_codon:yes gene_type:complete
MHSKNKILLVEDESSLAKLVVKYLSDNSYVCTHVSRLKSARELLKKNSYNTVLLDLGLPDGDGLSLIKEIKQKDYTCGVIIISAKDALDKKVEGLDLGADDYLTKPFFMPELNARVKSLIRRLNFEGNNEIVIGALKVIPDQMRLVINDCDIELTNTEFNLLLYFTSNKNRVLSKTNLAEYMSSKYFDYGFSDDVIYGHIKNLKKKLEKSGSPDYIRNIYGVGYKFTV